MSEDPRRLASLDVNSNAELPASIAANVAVDRHDAVRAAIAVCSAAGLEVVEPLPEDEDERTLDPEAPEIHMFEARNAAGAPAVLSVISYDTPADESGDPAEVARLLEEIGAALGRWRFMLHLRRRLPPGLDPMPVARAVHLWRLALDRGDWSGHHAVYEDDRLALDLTVIREIEGDGLAGPLVVVPPPVSVERLARVYKALVRSANTVDEVRADLPWVAVAVASARWNIARGYLLEQLYGLADRVATDSEGGFEAVFVPTGLTAFSDPTCRSLGALWWLELGGAGVAGQAHENPWAIRGAPANFPGPRLAVVERGGVRGEATLRWTTEVTR